MSPVTIVLLVILAVLIIALVVLYFLGKKAQKKQEAQEEQLRELRYPLLCQHPDRPVRGQLRLCRYREPQLLRVDLDTGHCLLAHRCRDGAPLRGVPLACRLPCRKGLGT